MTTYTPDSLSDKVKISDDATFGGGIDADHPFKASETNVMLQTRNLKSNIFGMATKIAAYGIFALVIILLYQLLKEGFSHVDMQFITSFPSRFPAKAGIWSAFIGSIYVILLTILFAIPIGVGAGVYFEEFLPAGKLKQFFDINVANLAGVPSIIYGILGLAIFVRFLGFGRSVLSAALTMTLLILPVIIITTREALLGVPQSIRHAAFAVGATKLETVWTHVLPNAIPGILTGVILSVSRAIGEAAPLIIVGAATFVPFLPENVFDEFTTLPIQIYNWASRPQLEFHNLAAAGIIVLLVILITTNAAAIIYRNKKQRSNPW